MKTGKATGVDEITIEEYEKNLAILRGYYRYYCVTDNSIMTGRFLDEVTGKVRRKASIGRNS
jgi:hypothetical protein